MGIAELLCEDYSCRDTLLPRESIGAYRWTIKARSGNRPAQAWLMPTPELNPDKQRILFRGKGYFDLEQADQLGRSLVELAQQVDPSTPETYRYKKILDGRGWSVGWDKDKRLEVQPFPGRILVCGTVDLQPRMAWEIGSYLQALSHQLSLKKR